ncbi:permease [Acetohalobium arabaticum]|uniref:Permease n=1 Tax=Acetohalobium arabaticum (strain ATCC 49924 / DSM 5501 / Z-7288) TaxID=574087 RepID=D9QVF3_ACEAZ|nr:permease [Acetohalobium arabaticum]ADL12212.1 conserved hypothetical protein [Acetohalobium arabaticum DSM 5501]
MLQMLKRYLLTIIFFTFVSGSFLFGYSPGEEIYFNFFDFLLTMLKFLPAVFILIGLFDVWVDREVIEKHLGDNSSVSSYFWAILLAGTTVGGLYITFPVAHAMWKKGASLRIIFTYIGAAAICRIPMTLFEASYVGTKFTLIRLLVSVPLVILTSILLEKYLNQKDYELKNNLS